MFRVLPLCVALQCVLVELPSSGVRAAGVSGLLPEALDGVPEAQLRCIGMLGA
jgi:hypothetical protein